MYQKRYGVLVYAIVAALAAALYFYGGTVLFVMAYCAVFLLASLRALQGRGQKSARAFLIIGYCAVLALQIMFWAMAVGSGGWQSAPLRRAFAVVFLALPLVISRYVVIGKYSHLYLPTIGEGATISFSEVREFSGGIAKAYGRVREIRKKATRRNIADIVGDMPRHDSLHYINNGSLTDEYFAAAERSMGEPYLYLVVSNTGTPASDLISVVTQKKYNHASVSFDRELRTTISYNGGERVYPPGLNGETLATLCHREGASILIYRLPVTPEQKRAAIERVRQINAEGSAYNMLGLLTNRSYRPNIMYCSQFVYRLFEEIGAGYFKAHGVIRPTDLIEKDYTRKLEFVEELLK